MKKIIQLVVVMLTTSLFLTSCNSGNDPESVAKDFIKAINDNDYKKAAEFCEEKTAALFKTLEPLAKMAGNEAKSNYEFVKTETKGDKATVTFKDKKKGEMQVELIKVDGKWKVSMGKEKLGGGDSPSMEAPSLPATPEMSTETPMPTPEEPTTEPAAPTGNN